MATTTNYAWETPDDTDLVKDGASAIRTLGSSIDTTTKALNPSTTLGDIEYRSATANTNTRLGIGTSGQVLTVNGSGVPAWGTVSSAPTFAGCMLFSSADQTVPNNTFTAVQFSATDYLDTDGYHDPSTNNTRITIPTGKGGKYLVINLGIFGNAPGPVRSTIYKNGSAFAEVRQDFSSGRGGPIDHLIMDLVAGDYIEFYAYQLSGGDNPLWGTTSLTNKGTRFGVSYLGA